jgi:hypothetical protein
VLGAEVFMGGASAWVVRCFSGSLGLLVFAIAGRGSVDVSSWVVGWIVLRT